MAIFKPGDKVIKRNETDASKYGQVMDCSPLHMKPGHIAVYFQRQVWIKPENLLHFEIWDALQRKKTVPTSSVRDFWTK